MAQIGLNITITGLTGNLIIRWKKSSSPLAEAGRNATPSLLTFPYDDVYVISNLSPVVYIVELWRSDDGTSLSQLIKDWSIDASKQSVATITTFQYKVDRGWNNTTPVSTGTEVWADPSDLDVTLVDERLDGYTQDQLIVHESGYGNLLNSEYDLFAGGGITLLGGRTFNVDTPWTITITSFSETTIPATEGGAMFDGVVILTANQDFDDITTPLANKLCIANWAGSVGTITFPDLTLIPDDTHVAFNTHGGSQNYLVLQFDAGDTVKFLNQNVNVIYVAKCQKISLYFKGGVCYVLDEPSNAIRRGQVANDYDSLRATNTGSFVLANESSGELLESDYPGIYAFVESLASGSVPLGTGVGQWSYDSGGAVYPNKRNFGIQTTAPKKIRVPHLIGMVAKLSSTPGVYEADAVKQHLHALQYKIGKSDDNESGVSSQYMREFGAAGGTNYGNDSANTDSTGGSENLVKSYSQIPFIYL